MLNRHGSNSKVNSMRPGIVIRRFRLTVTSQLANNGLCR